MWKNVSRAIPDKVTKVYNCPQLIARSPTLRRRVGGREHRKHALEQV